MAAAQAAALATGGASIPLEAILASIFGGSGILSMFSGNSPQDEATKYALSKIKDLMPQLQSTPYSQDEISNLAETFKNSIGLGTDVAKTKIGTTLSESMGAAGVPKGQPSASMYVSELSPLDATAITEKSNVDKWGANFWATLDDNAKNRALQALQLLSNTATTLPNQTVGQEGVSTFLNALNLLSSGGGNIAKMFKDLNWQPIKP